MEKKKIRKKVIIEEGGDAASWASIRELLEAHGIESDACLPPDCGEGARVKVICVSPDLKGAVAEMGESPRDQVVMVRVDEETSRRLDAWVESGAVRSRSEAAALFIREGLKVRGSELEQLEGALREVEKARARLRKKARQVFGDEPEPGDS